MHRARSNEYGLPETWNWPTSLQTKRRMIIINANEQINKSIGQIPEVTSKGNGRRCVILKFENILEICNFSKNPDTT